MRVLQIGESTVCPPRSGYRLCYAEARGEYIVACWGGDKPEDIIYQYFSSEAKLIGTLHEEW